MLTLEPALLRALDRVVIANPRRVSGQSVGPRRSLHHGSSPEFADFRNYVEGDDLRRVDWNAFARLDQLYLRLHAAEEMGTLTILVDRSRSMGFGRPRKSDVAGSLTAALAYVALRTHDRVRVAVWSNDIDALLPAQSGMRSFSRILEFVERYLATTEGETNLGSIIRAGMGSTGTAMIISDFLTNADIEGRLRLLGTTGQQVSVIQVLSAEELNPDLRGDWQLVDVENDRAVEVTVAPRALRRYRANLEAHTTALKETCRRYGIPYALIPTDLPLAGDMVGALLRAGIFA